jgi:hypothetical protein
MQRLNVIVGVQHIILGIQRALVGMLSKNFQASHQLDVDLCTEFPCTLYRQNCPLRIVYR